MMAGERVLLQFGLVSHVGFDAALLTLTQGRTLCFARTGSEAALLIRASAIDTIAGSVLQFRELVDAAQRMWGVYTSFESVRTAIIAGSYLSMEQLSSLRSIFRGEIYQIYGTTEAGSIAVNTGTMMAADGRTNRFVPMKDIDIVAETRSDHIGAISIRTPHLGAPFEGSLISKTMIDAHVAPGDVGYLDSEGFLIVAGRSDDVINIGGVKRSSKSLKRISQGARRSRLRHRSHRHCERASVCTLCRLRPGAQSRTLADWGAQDNLRFSFHHLSRIAAIPRNSSDKIERERVRAMAQTIVEAPTR